MRDHFCGVIFYHQILALPASSNARQDDEVGLIDETSHVSTCHFLAARADTGTTTAIPERATNILL